MQNGISLYLGLDNTPEENMQLIETAHKYGIKRIFTSLHIPETDTAALQSELQTVLQKARIYNMEVISDVSPHTLSLLNLAKLDAEALQQFGISTVRLDFGYGEKEIAALSKRIKVQFNASTLTKDFLDNLQFYQTDFQCIDALHNFYPRAGTGLSEAFLQKQNKLLHAYGVQTAAFVPSYNRARSPIKKGLPTLEAHRYKPVSSAAQQLVMLETDSVFIGDSLPTEKEMKILADLTTDYTTLKIKCLTQNQFVKNMLTENIFTVRVDGAEMALRLQEGRVLCRGEKIYPEYTAKRKCGMITLDNMNSGRYAGELQIVMKGQELDKSVNIIGKVLECDMILLKYLKPDSKIKFEWV